MIDWYRCFCWNAPCLDVDSVAARSVESWVGTKPWQLVVDDHAVIQTINSSDMKDSRIIIMITFVFMFIIVIWIQCLLVSRRGDNRRVPTESMSHIEHC